MLAFCSSPTFINHNTGPHHPERPDRIRAIYRALHDAKLLASPDPFPEFKLDLGIRAAGCPMLLELQPAPADQRWLRTVHPQSYIDRVQHMCQIGGTLDQGDTPCGPGSFEEALLASGAVLRCCDAVLRGEARRAFAAVRPPGHHAEPDRPMGFCLFSNIAVGANYIRQAYGVERIAIVDFDVHHGNGTQAAFDADPGVFFISLHQHPRTCYPGSGYEWEIGTGPGRGYTLNIPFNPGADDADYLQVIDNRVVPELEEFRPQVLMMSAGFDAHRLDPLASIELSDDGFELITRSLVAVADRHCQGKVVSVLEGGYNLLALGRSVVRHMVGMSGE